MSADAYEKFLRNRILLNYYEKKFPLVGFHPLAQQRAFIGSKAKVSVFSAGNRSGKSYAGAFKAAALANGVLGRFYDGFQDQGKPTRGVVSCLDYRLAVPVRKRLEHFLGVTLRKWNQATQTFTIQNGSEIVIKSEESGEQKYQADDFDWAWKDEAGDYKAEGIFNEIMRALTDSDGQMFMTLTPTLGTSWVGPRLYEPWNDRANGVDGTTVDLAGFGISFFFGNTMDNKHLNVRGLRSFVAMQVTEEQKLVRLHGRFVTLEGLVYSMFKQDRHVVPPFTIPKEWLKWRAMDFGLAAPSTCLWGAAEPPTPKDAPCPCPPHLQPHTLPRLHLYREVYDTRRGHTVKDTCDWIKRESGDERYVMTLLDPSCWAAEAAPEIVGGHFVVAEEYERNGIFPQRANNDVEAGVERLWGWLGDGSQLPQLVIHSTCSHLLMEMKRQKWKRSSSGLLLTQVPGGMGDKIEKGDPDHLLDPARYLAMASPLGGGLAMRGPDSDPFPYREWDPMEEGHFEEPVEDEQGFLKYRETPGA